MARSPTLSEYKSKPEKGIQRCDDLLEKNPQDSQLLITKLQLQATICADEKTLQETTHQLLTAKPLVRNLEELSIIEEAIIEAHQNVFPTPTSAGPNVAKLWDNACKAATNINQKLDLLSLRLHRAIIDNRLLDAQQSLIQLKVLAPKNRVFYMAHAAFTQLLSTTKDDLQSRLALSLARKAVNDKFDEDKSLDCRVPGQIFAWQESTKDLHDIVHTTFADSKQVSSAIRKTRIHAQASTGKPINSEDTSPRAWLLAEIESLKEQYSTLITSGCKSHSAYEDFAANAIRLFVISLDSLSLASWRPVTAPILLAVSALIKLWTLNRDVRYILISALLAQHLLAIQTDVHEAKVALLYLYSRLGLGSLAMRVWDDLSIKEIQYDTIGHAFLARISTLHPHDFKDTKTRRLKAIEPIRIITHALAVYHRCEDKLAETQTGILNHGQTGMIFDLHEIRESLRLSLTRRVISIEQRRMARFLNKKLDDQSFFIYPQLTAAYLDWKDTRDFSATSASNAPFNMGQALHDHDNPRSWILYNLAADALHCTMTKQKPVVKDIANLIDILLHHESTNGEAITDAESITGSLVLLMLRLAHFGIESRVSSQDILNAIEQMHVDELIHTTRTLPLLAQDVFTFIDGLRLASSFCKHAQAMHLLTDKQETVKIANVVDSAIKRLQDYAKEQAARKSHAALVQSLLDHQSHTSGSEESSLVKSVAALKANTSMFYEEIAESIADTWKGVAQIKI